MAAVLNTQELSMVLERGLLAILTNKYPAMLSQQKTAKYKLSHSPLFQKA